MFVILCELPSPRPSGCCKPASLCLHEQNESYVHPSTTTPVHAREGSHLHVSNATKNDRKHCGRQACFYDEDATHAPPQNTQQQQQQQHSKSSTHSNQPKEDHMERMPARPCERGSRRAGTRSSTAPLLPREASQGKWSHARPASQAQHGVQHGGQVRDRLLQLDGGALRQRQRGQRVVVVRQRLRRILDLWVRQHAARRGQGWWGVVCVCVCTCVCVCMCERQRQLRAPLTAR